MHSFSKGTQRGEGRNIFLIQLAKELSHLWQLIRWHISLDNGIPQWKDHFEHSCSLSWVLHAAILFLIPVVTTQWMPPTLSKPQSSAENSVCYLRVKKEVIFFLLSRRKKCLCSFLQLDHWIPISFYLLWAPQFHFHFFFPSIISSQAKACMSLPLKDLSLTQLATLFIQQPYLEWTNYRIKLEGMGEKKGKEKE